MDEYAEEKVPRPATFLDRRRWDPRTRTMVAEPLRERIPIYLKLFVGGLVAVGAVALIIYWLSSARLEHAFGFGLIFTGVAMLLVGGARGGGYSNIGIGAVEAIVGGRNRSQEDATDDAELRHGNVMKRRDPMARLRRGLRPPPNPSAFWSVVAGLLYIAIGVPFTL